jgi:hypothetical protein
MMTKTKIEGQFYPLTADVARTLRFANLTAAEWRLWSYLVELDPWGDRYSNLPDVLTIMEECDLKKSTFYKAIAKFQELELFDFQALWMSFRNLFGVPKIRNPFRENGNHSENSETIPKIRKTVRENGKVSDSSENQSLNPLLNQDSSSPQTFQTAQTIHTSQIAGEGEMQATTNVIKEEVASTEVLLAEEINNNSSSGQEKLSFGKENNSGVRRIVVIESNQGKKPAALGSRAGYGRMYTQTSPLPPAPFSPASPWRWLPDGPWNVDGKLDREFQEWLAKKWMAEYNRTDIYKALADVLLHFKKDPTNLAVWWEVYQSQYIAKARNMKTRLDHGCKISKEEQLCAIANHRAVLPMSEEQQQTTSIQNSQSSLRGRYAPAASGAYTPLRSVNKIQNQLPPIQNPKSKIQNEPQPVLEAEMTDPVFRKDSEILGKVKQYLCLGYLADYDDAGYPISVYMF